MISYSNQISVEDYNNLRKSVGWNTITPKQAEKGLANSVCFAAKEDGRAVALARLITDGGYVSAIYDVIVLPEYQRQGLGTALLNKVIDYIMNNLEDGEDQMIGLFAATGKEAFYKKFGFIERPNEKLGPGMTMWIKKETASGFSSPL